MKTESSAISHQGHKNSVEKSAKIWHANLDLPEWLNPVDKLSWKNPEEFKDQSGTVKTHWHQSLWQI